MLTSIASLERYVNNATTTTVDDAMSRRDDDISPSVTPGGLGGTADPEASSKESAQ